MESNECPAIAREHLVRAAIKTCPSSAMRTEQWVRARAVTCTRLTSDAFVFQESRETGCQGIRSSLVDAEAVLVPAGSVEQ